MFENLLAAGWTPATLWSMVVFAAAIAACATYAIDQGLREDARPPEQRA
jgi:hypothetical protein